MSKDKIEIDEVCMSRFLSLLDPTATFFTFQTVPEPKKKPTSLWAEVLHGSLVDLLPKLSELNRQGAAIYVTINETDGRGRKTENIVRVRAIWQDDDDGYKGDFPLEPSIVVSSSPGRFQRYWLAEDLSKDDYAGLMRTMVEEFGSDKNDGVDLAKVLRVPGFYHNKSKPHLVRIVEACGKRYAAEELLRAFPKTRSSPSSFAPIASRPKDEETLRIKNALKLISPETYGSWIKVGQILHASHDGRADGLLLWMEWAQASHKFDREEHIYKWRSFGRTSGKKLGLATLFWMANQALYERQ